ncbi:MAG: MCE family protein [Tildeniella nuda ZEHNDER 1965/U140]|jgi:phospholipid/cholesterol/gamma-HCH transport system substrate-binding protein|nr:MCE family protein [Tildeniella nuda ZEHNDER 1965/U140]
MRSRTVREGSVGLLILLGLGLFAGLILWLRGISVGNRGYKVVIDFANVAGMEVGTPVRYRGVAVGKITKTRPGPNGVEVEVEISPADLLIPNEVKVEANQSGLLGSTSIDITPRKQLTAAVDAKPLDAECNTALIICNKSRLTGRVGVSVDELIRSSMTFANAYSNPAFVADVQAVTKNSAQAAAEVAALSREFKSVAVVVKQQVSTLSASSRNVDRTVTKLGLTADQVNGLLATNRSNLVGTLGNINVITAQLRTTVATLNPIVGRVQQGQLLQNLETLSANAAQASANLRDVSNALNSPSNLTVLQQTLDSARVTFQNVQKITSDLDDLTGDPAFRANVRKLVNGLSGLVSSSQQLQQQAQLAQILTPIAQTAAANPTPLPSGSVPVADSFGKTVPEKTVEGVGSRE